MVARLEVPQLEAGRTAGPARHLELGLRLQAVLGLRSHLRDSRVEMREAGERTDASRLDLAALRFADAGHQRKAVGRLPLRAAVVPPSAQPAGRELGIASHTAGVARNERAAAAARELHALQLQIAAACPGDPTIGLDAGADALRSTVNASSLDPLGISFLDLHLSPKTRHDLFTDSGIEQSAGA